MSITEEQQCIIDAVCSSKGDKIIAVNAVAGSGKTSTALEVVKAYQPINGFLFAFNKAIIEDSKKRFGKLINCSTIHSLAYKYIRPKKPIEEFNYNSITEKIPYEDKAKVIFTLDRFFRSSSVNIYDYVEHILPDEEELQKLIIQYANMMLEGKINPTFNYLLKCLHIKLVEKEITIEFDLLILDEAQDTTAVALEIFKHIHATKVIFGDKYQNIYSFMDTVNGFEELDNLVSLKLTQSFRCTPAIANVVQDYGQRYLEKDFKFKSNEEIVPNKVYKVAYLSRSNATLIKRMYNLFTQGENFLLIRHPNEIFALPIALLNAANGREVFDKKYKFLEREYKRYVPIKHMFTSFYQYINLRTNDEHIEATGKLILHLKDKGINLWDLRKKTLTMTNNPNIILTTVHAYKGLECDNVWIENDLNRTISNVKEKLIKQGRGILSSSDKENLNTYYVALSRAKVSLHNVNY